MDYNRGCASIHRETVYKVGRRWPRLAQKGRGWCRALGLRFAVARCGCVSSGTTHDCPSSALSLLGHRLPLRKLTAGETGPARHRAARRLAPDTPHSKQPLLRAVADICTHRTNIASQRTKQHSRACHPVICRAVFGMAWPRCSRRQQAPGPCSWQRVAGRDGQ